MNEFFAALGEGERWEDAWDVDVDDDDDDVPSFLQAMIDKLFGFFRW